MKCGDKVKVGKEDALTELTCSKEKNHPLVGFSNGQTTKYQFHEGDGWVWDNSCAWRKGEEPR